MFLLKLAWKNLWRNRNRTLISMAAIFFAVVLSIATSSLRQGIFDNLIKNVVSFYTGYGQVHRRGYQDEQIIDNSFPASTFVEKTLLENSNIAGYAPRLESFALAASGNLTKGCMVVGIDPDNENQITSLRSKMVEGFYLDKKTSTVLMAEGLAGRLKLSLNDTLILIAQGFHGATAAGKFPITGIARFGSPEVNDRVLFMPIAATQEFYNAPNMLTAIVLLPQNPEAMDEIAASLRTRLGDDYEVLTWSELLPDIKQHIETDTGNAVYVQGILYLLICFGIFGTVLMMVEERRYETGMLLAIGMSRIKLLLLLFTESLLSVSAACLLGMAASVPLIFYFKEHPLTIGGEAAETYRRFGFEPIFPTSPDLSIFLRQGIIVLIMGLLLSLYPMAKALFLHPVSAMRK